MIIRPKAPPHHQLLPCAQLKEPACCLSKSGSWGACCCPLRTQVLNISRLLSAALTARSAESVEAGVSAMVRWVEANGAQKRTCFLDGECGARWCACQELHTGA